MNVDPEQNRVLKTIPKIWQNLIARAYSKDDCLKYELYDNWQSTLSWIGFTSTWIETS